MRYLLAFFFFLMYIGDDLGANVGFAPGLSTKNLLLYLIVTGIAVNAAVARNRRVELTGVHVLFGLIMLYALITWVTLSFVVQNPEYQVKEALISYKSNLVDQYLTFLIFFYGLLHLKDSMWLLRAMLWIAMIGNIVTIIDTMNIPDLGVLPAPEKRGRFEGFIGQPNAYGQFLVLYLPACIALYLQERGTRRALAGIGVFATLLALVLTASRGAYVGLICGAMLAAFYLRQHIPTQAVVRAGVVAGVLCAVAVAVTFITGYADLYTDRFTAMDGSAHVITSGRTSLWAEALSVMMQNPWSFISGYGYFSYESHRGFRLAIHNQYLSYLYSLGLVGTCFFIAMFARIAKAARTALTQAPENLVAHYVAFAVGLFSFLIAIVFSEYHETGYMLWAYVGVMMRTAMVIGRVDAADPALAEAHAPPARPGQAPAPGTQGWAHRDAWTR